MSFKWAEKHTGHLSEMHGVNVVKKTEIHIAEPLVHEPRAYEVVTATELSQRCKSPNTDQITAELIQARGLRSKNLFCLELEILSSA